jgi:hypothetical protein
VRFTNQDIFHVGDTYDRRDECQLGRHDRLTIIIPGHGQPISNRSELKDYSDMLTAKRGNIAELKKQGRSLEDIIAAKPTYRFDAKWGRFVIGPTFFTELVFKGV